MADLDSPEVNQRQRTENFPIERLCERPRRPQPASYNLACYCETKHCRDMRSEPSARLFSINGFDVAKYGAVRLCMALRRCRRPDHGTCSPVGVRYSACRGIGAFVAAGSPGTNIACGARVVLPPDGSWSLVFSAYRPVCPDT